MSDELENDMLFRDDVLSKLVTVKSRIRATRDSQWQGSELWRLNDAAVGAIETAQNEIRSLRARPQEPRLKMDGCVFCDLIERGDHTPNDWSEAGPGWRAFTPLNPATKGHLLVVPTTHVSDALERPDVTANVMGAAATIAKGDCNLITSVGEAATQSVRHLHIHIVPRRENDGLQLPWSAPSGPQEPRLSKEWLDKVIEGVAKSESTFGRRDRWAVMKFRDAILSAPSGPQEPELPGKEIEMSGTNAGMAIAINELLKLRDSLDRPYESGNGQRMAVLSLAIDRLESLSAPSGPLSDPDEAKWTKRDLTAVIERATEHTLLDDLDCNEGRAYHEWTYEGDCRFCDATLVTFSLTQTRDAMLKHLRGPLSDEPRENENQDVAAPVLGGDG